MASWGPFHETKEAWQEQSQRFIEGKQDHHQCFRQKEWPKLHGNAFQFFSRHRRQNKQAGPNWRCHQRDVERENDHDARVHGVHADGIGQRHQNRGDDDQRGRDIHHHAHDKQETHDHRDDHIRVVRHGPHLSGDGLRNLIEAQPPAQNGGKPDDDKDHTDDDTDYDTLDDTDDDTDDDRDVFQY